MAKIELTPAELKQQSVEMAGLKAQYENLFSGVQGILIDVNQNWSANLAHNFEGKLNTAQHSFLHINSMLQAGADLAQLSADTYESVDNILAGAIHGRSGLTETIGVVGSAIEAEMARTRQQTIANILSGRAEALESGQSISLFIEEIEKARNDDMGKLSESFYDYIDMLMGKDSPLEAFKSGYEVVRDVITGDIEMGTVEDVVKVLQKSNMKVDALFKIWDTFTGEDNYYQNRVSEWEAKMTDEILKGDIITASMYFGAEVIDVLGKGCVDVLGQMAGEVIAPGINFIDVAFGTNIAQTANDVGTAIGDAFSAGLEASVDVAGEIVTVMGNTMTEGCKIVGDIMDGIGDAFGSLFG